MRRFGARKVVAISVITIVLYFGIGCALLPLERVEGRMCLPGKLEYQLHIDYPYGLQWVPRTATSWCMTPQPRMVLGNQKNFFLERGVLGPEAIPAPGSWQLSFVQVRKGLPFFLPYFAVTTIGKWHWRFGCRWDQRDGYYTFPSGTIKKIQ